MDRRAYLATLAAGAVGLAGCASGDGTQTATPPDRDAPGERRVAVPGREDVELPVPRSEVVYAVPEDTYPAVVDPVVGEDWGGVELPGYSGSAATPRLEDTDRVIGVERDGRARAYPLRLLAGHEVVNDDFGAPLLVTYCPICGSGVAARRTVGGEATLFGVSGKLWQSDLVLYDERTRSLWSQILATAIRGERTGTRFDLVPSTLTTWGQWREAHPGTQVVRPPPESGTIDGSGAQYYGTERYDIYRESDQAGRRGTTFEDDRLHPKTIVLGVADGETARAYPLPAVREAGVVNDTVGDRPVVVSVVESTIVAYERTVDGGVLRFERAGDGHMAAAGSRWETLTGRAVDGPREGTRLANASKRSQLFWFAWLEFFPDTELYRA